MNKKGFFKLLGLCAGLSLAVGAGVAAVGSSGKAAETKADDELAYTLTPTSGSNNGYAGNCDITVGDITWNLTGNSTMIPWRIGGKNLTGVNRELYSKTAISDSITKIEVTHGTASSITINSWTVIVSKNADFSSPISTLTPTFEASSTTTITRPDGKDWSDCYFKFVYNVTVGKNNQFLQFTKADFYKALSKYDVTFNMMGHGSAIAKQSINQGGKVTKPANPSETGYDFGGWYKEETCTNAWDFDKDTVSAATDLYAKWTKQSYDVIDDVTKGSLTVPSQIEYGGSLNVTIVPETGYGLPENASDITVNGATLVSYNNSTGVVGLSNATGPVTVTAVCVALGHTYNISVNVSGGEYEGDSTITDNGGVASVTISPTGDHKLPSAAIVDEITYISVSGADFTYNASTGVISLSNASDHVEIEVTCPDLTSYTIFVNDENATHTGADAILEGKTSTLTFTPSDGWGQPAEVEVDGASGSWNRDTGVLTLSNPTKNVSVFYSAAENELTSITLSVSSGNYTLGDDFVKPTVTAHYTVEDDKDVTSETVFSGYDAFTTGDHVVIASFTDGEITKEASYTANVGAIEVGFVYEKVSDLNEIVEGDYILAYSTYAFDGRDASNGYTSVTIEDNQIAHSLAMDKLSVHIIPLTGSNAGKYTMAVSSSNDNNPEKYVTGNNANDNKLTFSGSAENLTISARSADRTETDGDWDITGSGGNVLSFNATSGQNRFRFYKTATYCNEKYHAVDLYKKTSSGSASVIRIVCDPSIDGETGYKGGDKLVGEIVKASDFVVKKQLNTGNDLIAVTGFTINGGSEATLNGTSNEIIISYNEGGEPFEAVVNVPATQPEATLTSVSLKLGENVKDTGYIAWSGAEWDLTDISIVYDWTVDSYDSEVSLASLIGNGATITPAAPIVGATSFTVSYTYLNVSLSNATVNVEEVIADYIESVSWKNKSLSHFKSYNGGELTAQTVNGWSVKAHYAGAGDTSNLSFGTGENQFSIMIGDKPVTSLPYEWKAEDDGKFVSVVVGGVSASDATYGKTNICPIINDISNSVETQAAYNEAREGYYLVESASDLKVGDSYIIAASGYDVAMSTTQNTNNRGATDITKDGVQLGAPSESVQIFTLESGTKSGTYAFSIGDGYICAASSTANHLKTTTSKSDNSSFTISINDKGVASIVAQGSYTRNTMQYNNGSTLFACYGSASQSAIALYRFVSETIYHDAVYDTTHYANLDEHFDAQKAVVKFAKAFNEAMNAENVCSGSFENLEAGWANAAKAFDNSDEKNPGFLQNISSLSTEEQAYAKNMLAYATAEWSDDTDAACVEKAMATYKHVVRTYKLNAFMSDFITVQSSVNVGLNSFLTNNDNSLMIVVVISAIGLVAVGGSFYARRKEQ